MRAIENVGVNSEEKVVRELNLERTIEQEESADGIDSFHEKLLFNTQSALYSNG